MTFRIGAKCFGPTRAHFMHNRSILRDKWPYPFSLPWWSTWIVLEANKGFTLVNFKRHGRPPKFSKTPNIFSKTWLNILDKIDPRFSPQPISQVSNKAADCFENDFGIHYIAIKRRGKHLGFVRRISLCGWDTCPDDKIRQQQIIILVLTTLLVDILKTESGASVEAWTT